MTYYNENDAYAAQWLRNLIAANLITEGEVDERSIKDVQSDDLKGFQRCHFFAGISGWELALQQAEWGDEEVWTGSCPCQPFSVAGKQRGVADDRHLWPEFYRLIAERCPATVFGEQVAAASTWLAGVRSDLEAVGYAVGATPIEAACTGAPQYRDRFWFVASLPRERSDRSPRVQGPPVRPFVEASGVGELPCDDFQRESDSGLQRSRELSRTGSGAKATARELASSNDAEWGSAKPRGDEFERTSAGRFEGDSDSSECGDGNRVVQLAYQYLAGLEGCESIGSDTSTEQPSTERSSVSSLGRDPSNGWGSPWTEAEFRSRGFTAAVASLPDGAQFIECPDGKWRRLPPPGVRWLGNGISSRVAKLRAFGNAIYPPAAAEFIAAYMEVRP